MQDNSPRQFMAMSAGGPIGNILLVLLIYILIPIDNPGRAALFAVTLGQTVAVVRFEVPVIFRTMMGGKPQEELDKQIKSC